VETHIFLCVPAYRLPVPIHDTEDAAGPGRAHTSWAVACETLKTHQVAAIALPAGENLE